MKKPTISRMRSVSNNGEIFTIFVPNSYLEAARWPRLSVAVWIVRLMLRPTSR